jgi:hypothetical protein
MVLLASESGTTEGEQIEIAARVPISVCMKCQVVGISTPKSKHNGEEVESDGWNLPKLGRDLMHDVFGIESTPCEKCFGTDDEDPLITPMIEGRVN